MRILIGLVWLAVGTVLLAWHDGPGQEHLSLDTAGQLASKAASEAQQGRWAEAVEGYDAALVSLPEDQETLSRDLRLERAKARVSAGQLPEARMELESLLDQLKADPKASRTTLAGARQALATTQYYVTWLLRLEGEPAQVWEPEIESARQLHRLLAEDADKQGDAAAAAVHREDVEATIRLARMDLSELQALNLPSCCSGCKSGACKSACKGKRPGNGKDKPQDSRGAGMGPPPDEAGN